MKNTKIFKVILIIIATLLVVSIAFDVNAATSDGDLLTLAPNSTKNSTTNSANNGTTNSTKTNNTTNNSSAVNTTNKTNTSAYTKNNTGNLPKTGIGDHTGLFVILGVCVVSAIYAYKKSNKYNEIK